jgi:hypothetical protein
MLFEQVLRALGLVLGLSLFLCANNVGASKITMSGSTAQGGWEQIDGCVTTDVSVVASDDVLFEAGAGGPQTTTILSASIITLDFCTGTFTNVGADGTGEFTMTALNEARARGTLPAFILKGKTRVPAGEITIDVTFVASGDVQRTFFIGRASFGTDFRSTAKGSSRLRDASITGSVKLNGVETVTGSPGVGIMITGTQATFERGF